jgi:hypothetical protein
MADHSMRIWLLDDKGNKKGPFSLEELQKKVTHGEIEINCQVLTDPHSPPNTTVMDLLKVALDPAFSLLDTLQLAREKNAFAKRDFSASHLETAPYVSQQDSSKKMRVLLILILVFSLGGILSFLLKGSPPPSSNEPEAIPPTTLTAPPSTPEESPPLPIPRHQTPQSVAPHEPSTPPTSTPLESNEHSPPGAQNAPANEPAIEAPRTEEPPPVENSAQDPNPPNEPESVLIDQNSQN